MRATKGQHTKNDAEETPVTKKKGGKKGKKVKAEKEESEEAEDDGPVRCVCGVTESEEGDPDPWIACEKCKTWQHNVCVGVSYFDEDVDDMEYFCEQCKPSDHKLLLEARAKGIDLWKTRQEAYKQDKKGKKGKGKRASEVKLETPKATNGKAKSPLLQDSTSTPKAGGGKRNARDDSQDDVKVSLH